MKRPRVPFSFILATVAAVLLVVWGAAGIIFAILKLST